MATSIHALKESTADELSERTGIKANLITMYLKEMEQGGLMTSRRESYRIYYSLTSFGEKIAAQRRMRRITLEVHGLQL